MMAHIRHERAVDAPRTVVWDVITDHELYADAAPNLESIEVLDGEAETMVRRCVDTSGNEWTERCTRWEDHRGFRVSVDVEESDFHRRLFSRFEGKWRVEEAPEGVTMVVEFDFEPKFGPLGWVIGQYFAYKAPALVDRIFDRWEAAIESRRAAPDPEADRRTNALYP